MKHNFTASAALALAVCTVLFGLLAAALPAPPVPSPPPAGSLEWEARIVGSASYAGLLEVRRRGTSAWGTVCDDYFSDQEAVAACHSVGFANASGAQFVSTSTQRSLGDGLIILDDVRCTSNDTYLDNCSKATSHDCGHTEDVTINCFPNDTFEDPPPSNVSQWEYRLLSSGSSSYLQARPTTVSPWGYFCASGFGEAEAEVACRSMGYAGAILPLTATRLLGTRAVYMRNITCPSDGAAIASACRYKFATEFQAATGTCPGSTYLSMACRSHRNAAAAAAHNDGWGVRFAQESASVTSGLLLVRPNTSEPWGTVCDDIFGSSDAVAACRSLGFASVTTSAVAYRSASSTEADGYTSAPIYMDNVRCSSSTSAYLPQCSFLYSDRDTTRHNCVGTELVYLSCAGPLNTSSSSSSSSSSRSSSRGAVEQILPPVLGGIGGLVFFAVIIGILVRAKKDKAAPTAPSCPAAPVPATSAAHVEEALEGAVTHTFTNTTIYGADPTGFAGGVHPTHISHAQPPLQWPPLFGSPANGPMGPAEDLRLHSNQGPLYTGGGTAGGTTPAGHSNTPSNLAPHIFDAPAFYGGYPGETTGPVQGI